MVANSQQPDVDGRRLAAAFGFVFYQFKSLQACCGLCCADRGRGPLLGDTCDRRLAGFGLGVGGFWGGLCLSRVFGTVVCDLAFATAMTGSGA